MRQKLLQEKPIRKSSFRSITNKHIRAFIRDSRKSQLQAYQQCREQPKILWGYNPGLLPLSWQECSAVWAIHFIVASKGQEALTLHLPIRNSLQTSDFALAFTIAYQLEAERDLIHPTSFLIRDLHISNTYGVRNMTKGTYKVEAVERLPNGIGKATFRLFKKEDLTTTDA
jgi:hypothetical protein